MVVFMRIAKWYFVTLLAGVLFATSVQASDYAYPWRDRNKAIVIDAYEKNPIDWTKMVTDKRIRAFIAKSSDGLPSPWTCRGNTTERKICKKSFQNYWMKQQLYHTRKTLAKALGLKWGAYHLGRPGNPIAQANHFLQFAQPEKDELIALDIEHDDPEKWISFEDAEIFARHIYKRIGRYPVLYTNHETAKRIAARRDEFPILSRMQLWYARFKGDVRGSFPMGNWESYTLWQFSAHPNCNKRRCLYRVPGTEPNIDVNISKLSIAEFEKAWPFDGLVPERVADPEILMVDAAKPVVDVDQNVTVASIVPSAVPSANSEKPLAADTLDLQPDLQLDEEAKFQIASIDPKSVAIPTARFREYSVVAKVETQDQTKPEQVAAVESALPQKKPQTPEQTGKPVTLATVSKSSASTTSVSIGGENDSARQEVAEMVDPGEIVAGENLGPIGNLQPRLINNTQLASEAFEGETTPSPRYLKDVTLLIGESPYSSL